MKTLIYILLLSASGNLCAQQDYRAYQRTFNRVDEDVLAGNYPQALARLDSVYSTCDFVFAYHCVKSLQICCAADDSLRAEQWLAKAFRQGVPLYIVRSNGLMKKSLSYGNAQHVVEKYDSLHAIYEQSINWKVRKEIDSMILRDQQLTKKVNDGFFLWRYTVYLHRWKKNNVSDFNRIREITEQYGYPGERLIGLAPDYSDSVLTLKNIDRYGPNLRETNAHIMLIHYFSNPRKDVNELMLKNVINGYLPPDFYASWNDFLAEWGRGKYGNYLYYNAWHTDPDEMHLPEINIRRNALGLNDYGAKQRKSQIMLERRKNKTANQEILLE